MKGTSTMSLIACWLCLCTVLAAPFAFAQQDEASVAFTSETQFSIPASNGSIGFAMGGSYTYASLENGTWNFAGLDLSGSSSAMPLPMPTGFNFSASAQNSHVAITQFTRLNVFPPMGTGILEYTVSGVGSQTFNVYYPNHWLKYTVTVDGVAKEENDGWAVTGDGWLTVTGATSAVKVTYGLRPSTAFTSADRFAIPSLNSTIAFAWSGTYVYADLENNTWRFQNLHIDEETTSSGIPRWALGVSAQNCNVTITSFVSQGSSGWLNYTVAGAGMQTLNSVLDRLGGWPLNFTVYIDGIEKPQNDSWTASGDEWATVTGAKENVSIACVENVPDWLKDMPPPGPTSTAETTPMSLIGDVATDNRPLFYAIVGAAIAVAVVVVAVVALKRKHRQLKINSVA